MRGYLYAEEYLSGRPNSTYVKRYFVSFPFCGVKWFSEEPKGLNDHALLTKSGDNCGWLFGSNIILHTVSIEDAFTVAGRHKEPAARFPFRVTLKSGEHFTDIKLASTDSDNRQDWVDELFHAMKALQFVNASFESDFIPYSAVFEAMQGRVDAVDIPLSTKALSAVALHLNAATGHKFKVLKLVNTGLTDSQMLSVAKVIHACPGLEVFSLASNQCTSAGLITLCDALMHCTELKSLDLSFNRIDDEGMDALTRLIAPSRLALKNLNLSHNLLTSKCIPVFIKRVGSHNCKLSSVDLSHNALGDAAATFLSLLLYNQPSLLQQVGLAYCSLGEAGVKELTLAIPACTTLIDLNVQGSFVAPATLQAFMQAVGALHSRHSTASVGQQRPAMAVSVGGTEQSCSGCTSLSLKALKVALPYCSESTGVYSVSLRRHLPYRQESDEAAFDKFSASGSLKFKNMLTMLDDQEPVTSSPGEDHALLVARLRLPAHLHCVEEWTEALAIALGIDASQLRLLGHSTLHCDMRYHSVTLSVTNLSFQRAFALHSRNHAGFVCTRDVRLLHYEPTQSQSSILAAVEALANKCSPLLKALGLVSMRIRTSSGGEDVDIDVTLEGGGLRGRGLEDHYIVPLSGKDVSQFEGNGAGEDTEDDESFDRSVREALLPVSEEVEGDEGEEWDEEREDRMLQAAAEEAARAEEAERVASEALMAAQAARRNLRTSNERLVLAVRHLYSERIISSQVGRFWEGAFGHVRHKEVTKKAMEGAIDQDTGIFHSVHKREQICNAMFQRDLTAVGALLAELRQKPNGAIEGGLSFVLGQRLFSELVSLRKKFADVEHVCQSYDKLSLVEDFLLSCGVLGYSGPEMFQAVELRQQLVAEAAGEGHPHLAEDLPVIKYKALLSNLMISRDLPSLEDKLEELKYSSDDHLIFLPETVAAQTLLDECANCIVNLEAAIKAKDIEMLDNALAANAYHLFYTNNISHAIDLLNAVSKNPSKLLLPIVTGLRNNDMLMINNGFEVLNKMGWHHPALDSVIVSRIFAQKSKIVQDDGVKSKLIKLCLAINNGFVVKPGEMMQLLRRAHSIGLEFDADMKPYMTILNKHMRKFAGLVKQEKAIQKMIDEDDVPSLAKVLAGRGQGKLVMSAPSAFVQEEWLINLEEVCTGSFMDRVTDKEGNFNEHELCFTGVLEKAARTEEAGGKIGGWRRRFFVLETISLTYYTKAAGGEKKGAIRVLGGGVRKMDPSEVGGRRFCLELEEGRDISLINPDLLEEARRHVRLAKINEIQASLLAGIKARDLGLLTKTLQFAADLEIMLSFDLMSSAKQCIQALREKSLRKDLHSAALLVPEGRLFELVSTAEALKVDPHIPSFSRVIELTAKPDVDQCLLRARGALVVGDAALFRRVFKQLAKFDISLLSTRQRYSLGSVVMFHCGTSVLTMIQDGAPAVLVYKAIRHALSCCRQLMVEPECMDAGRLLIALASRQMGQLLKVATSEKVTSLAMYLDHCKVHNHSNPQLDARKFSRLRLNSSHHQKGFVSSLFTGRGKDAPADLISFNSAGLAKSLLKYEPGVLDQALCVEAFQVLTVIMGDKPLNSLSRPKKTSIVRTKASSITSAVLDLIDAAAVRFPLMRDEVYFQLIKQLSNNPTAPSRYKGWLLFSLYLHAFKPSHEAFPHVKDFISDAFESLLRMRSGGISQGKSEAEEAAMDATEVKYFLNVVSYCLKLVCSLVESMHQSVDARAVAAAAGAVSVAQITADVVDMVFSQRPLSLELVTMTGSVYQCGLPYGQFNTSFSLLCHLYERLVPAAEQSAEFDSYPVDPANFTASPLLSEKYYCAHSRAQQVMALFRGCGLYAVEEEHFNGDLTEVDISRVPVQPDVHLAVDPAEDLQWDLLLATCNDPLNASQQAAHSRFTFAQTLLLRRRNAMTTERFTDTFELFGEELSVRDVSGLQAKWSAWLASEETHSRLPVDHVRVDLQFAEDTRYVNSRLYPLSEDGFHYLLALQLALCWVDERADGWGEGDDGVIEHMSVAVRPSYKFFPRPPKSDESVTETHEEATPRPSEVSREPDHDSDSEEETRRLHDKMRRGSASASDDDDDDDSDGRSGESSSYQSSEEAEEVVVKEKKFLQYVVANYEDLGDEDRQHLLSLLESIGVAVDSIQIDILVANMRAFHALASGHGVALTSEKYRYLMKRGYVEYLRVACPFYGSFFTETTLASTSNDESQGQRVEDGVLDALDESKVIMGLSAGGLALMDASDWTVLFKAPIWDIHECHTEVVTKTVKTKVKGKKAVTEKSVTVLTVVVNTLTLTFKGEKLDDVVYILHEWTREILGRGYFPYGAEYPVEAHADRHSASSSKVALHLFLQTYPLMPKPPVPEDEARSERYFEAPKSRREILARERAEEERVEQEMIRLANESQMERNQKQIKQGRAEMMKYQTESEAEGFGDDDDDDDRDRKEKKRSKRLNRSVFRKSVGAVELREQIAYDRLCAAVSGVTERTASQLNSVVIPSVPMMVNRVMKFDNVERKRQTLKPAIEESRGFEALEEVQNVGLSWNLTPAAAIPQAKPQKRTAKGGAAHVQELLMQTKQRRVAGYLEASEEAESYRYAQMAALEGPHRDEDDSRSVLTVKDVYLHGLSQYTKKKYANTKPRTPRRGVESNHSVSNDE